MFLITLLQKFRTRSYIRRSLRFRKIFSEISKSLMLIVDYDQLMDNVVARVREIVQTDAILIFMHNQDFSRFELKETGKESLERRPSQYFRADDPLIRWFGVNKTFLNVDRNPAVFSYFNEREQNILREAQVIYLFPLLAMNRVIGLVGLGMSGDKREITYDNVELLNFFFAQAALAFENAYLYKQQRSRLTRMYRADRLATIGELAAGAAHEIRNPLTSIRSTVQYLKKNVRGENSETMVEGVLEEVDRINSIIEGLLSFSRPAIPEIETVDLESLIGQTIMLAGATASKKGCDIVFEYGIPQKALKADPSQLKQVFLNLILNALDAMEPAGRLHIAVRNGADDGGIMSGFRNNYVITFHDNGYGIRKEHLDQVFDPFFTTKKQGTGLGLSISYGIIRRHGGEIEIESATKEEKPEGHGTTVTITLPANP